MKKKSLSRKKSSTLAFVEKKNIEILYQKASRYIEHARHTIHRTIDTEMVKAYWCIGRDIVEEETAGQEKS